MKMKLVLGTAVMILLVGAPSYARQEPDKDKPQQEEPKKQEAPKKGEEPNKGKQDQPADKSKQEPAKQQQPQDRAKPAPQNDRTQQQQQDDRNRNQAAKPAQQNDRAQQQQQDERNQSKPAQQPDRPQDQQRAQQTGQHNDRANAGNANDHGATRRVPDEQFRASFGSSHHFHVQRGDRRFNYGGYYFSYSEAWPSDWDYNDDVYIDYIDGNYYLINPRHPGVRLLVVIVD
jgi:hypothetical protein